MSDEENKGSSYSQHGNHGIGHMSGGEIKDNAKVIGKLDTQNNVVNIIKKPINIAIATLTAIVGAVGVIFAGEYRFKSDNNNIKIGGNINAPTTFGKNSPLTIYKGDPPEVRQQKLERAKELIADEVYANILRIDSRLGFVKSILLENEYGKTQKKIEKLLPPALKDYSDANYRVKKFNQDISSLRNIYNNYPVSEISKPRTQVLTDTNTDPRAVRLFSNSLRGVKNASEWLLETLSNAVKPTSTGSKIVAYHDKQINHAIERLNNNSEQSYVFGLMLLDSLGIPLSEVQKNLSNLKHLEPPHPIGKDEINRVVVREPKRLKEQEKALLEKYKELISNEKIDLGESTEKLTVQPSDTWNQVAAKAIALRQLGYHSESVDAFSRYGEMFAQEDPTALQYSQTAQQFTIQLFELGVDGGVYLYEVSQNKADNKAGLEVGDIIIEYGEEKIVKVSDMKRVLQNTPTGSHNQLTYLRMNNAGEFKRQTVAVNSDPLVVGMMPI